MKTVFRPHSDKTGQAMIESMLVILLACFIFFSLFQYANLFASKTVLSHAAARAARSRSVGFNEWMVRKSALVAAIPASGKRLEPSYTPANGTFTVPIARGKLDLGDLLDKAFSRRSRSSAAAIEVNRVPQFMESVNDISSEAILKYERWEDTLVEIKEDASFASEDPSILGVRVRQFHPLLLSLDAMEEGDFHPYRTPVAEEPPEEGISLSGEYSIENHFPLYLEDAQW